MYGHSHFWMTYDPDYRYMWLNTIYVQLYMYSIMKKVQYEDDVVFIYILICLLAFTYISIQYIYYIPRLVFHKQQRIEAYLDISNLLKIGVSYGWYG